MIRVVAVVKPHTAHRVSGQNDLQILCKYKLYLVLVANLHEAIIIFSLGSSEDNHLFDQLFPILVPVACSVYLLYDTLANSSHVIFYLNGDDVTVSTR